MRPDQYDFMCHTKNKSRNAIFILDNVKKTFKRVSCLEKNPDAIADVVNIDMTHHGKGGVYQSNQDFMYFHCAPVEIMECIIQDETQCKHEIKNIDAFIKENKLPLDEPIAIMYPICCPLSPEEKEQRGFLELRAFAKYIIAGMIGIDANEMHVLPINQEYDPSHWTVFYRNHVDEIFPGHQSWHNTPDRDVTRKYKGRPDIRAKVKAAKEQNK